MESNMSKSVILTVLIVSAVTIFFKYYSHKTQNEQKEILLQSAMSQDDSNKLEQVETNISIQEISDDVRGQEDENGVRHDINMWKWRHSYLSRRRYL